MATYTKTSPVRAERSLNLRLLTAGLTASQAGVIAGIPQGFTLATAALTGTGVIVINFRTPFAQIPVVRATAMHATNDFTCTITALSVSSVTITCRTSGAAATPTQLCVAIEGSDVSDPF